MTITDAVIVAIITCALSLLGSYIMIRYQLNKQRRYELIKKFVDEANFLFTDFERIASYVQAGTQNSTEGTALQNRIIDKSYNIRALVFLISDSVYISKENKKDAEAIYSNVANILNQQGNISPHMLQIRNHLNKMKS